MKKVIKSVKGKKIGSLFYNNGIQFKITSFPTRYTVCGKNVDVRIFEPSSIKIAISKIDTI